MSRLYRCPIQSYRFTFYVLTCLLFPLLMPAANAVGQADFESYLTDAVSAQSAGNIPAAITAYQGALKIRRDVPEVWANLGLMQHQMGNYADALLSFRTANQLQPKLFVPILFIGLENLELGHRTDAIRYLLMARQLHPNDFEIHMNLGRAYFGQKEFDAAATSYQRAADVNPKSGEAWYRLGITYLEMAETASGALAKLNQSSPFFQALKAESLEKQDKLGQAEVIYQRLLTSQNLPPCTHSSFGLVLLREKKIADAEAEFQRDVHSGGCSLAALGLIRLSLEKEEGTEAALGSLNDLWTRDRGFLLTHLALLTSGMTAEQISYLDQTLAQSNSLSPEANSAVTRFLREGRTAVSQEFVTNQDAAEKLSTPRLPQEYYQRGEYRKCVNSLIPAETTLPRDKLSLLAACSFYTGDFHATFAAAKQLRKASPAEEGLYWSVRAEQGLAVQCLIHASEVEPDSIRLHELLAESYRDRGEYGEAETEYKVALRIHPEEFSALIGAAANYLQEYRIDLAAQMIQRALAKNPSDAEANYIMGEVLIAQRRYADAEPYLKAGLSAKAELTPRIHALLGQIYANQGETQHAIAEYKLGLPSDDDGSVHYQLGRLYQKLGESKLAAAAFEESKSMISRRQEAAHSIPDERPRNF
jgi:tetratricopeptide (TPR) repeat protein